jgi:hypothetical protein
MISNAVSALDNVPTCLLTDEPQFDEFFFFAGWSDSTAPLPARSYIGM